MWCGRDARGGCPGREATLHSPGQVGRDRTPQAGGKPVPFGVDRDRFTRGRAGRPGSLECATLAAPTWRAASLRQLTAAASAIRAGIVPTPIIR